jgi:hypothetical protein
MALNLSGYRAVQTANFVKLVIPDYTTLRFSDDTKSRTISGESYTNIGQLLYISESRSEIRALEREVSLGLSGIPAGSIAEFLDNNPKGSKIEIRQAFFNPVNDTLLAISGNPLIKFKGIVSNFSMEETWDAQSKLSTFTIVLQCTSLVSSIFDRVNGRRTNDSDQQTLFPGDLSMSRVSTITGAQFQFGKPGGAQV